MWIYLEPVDQTDVHEQVPTNVFNCLIMTISSILHLKTPTVRTTSLKNSLSMVLGKKQNKLKYIVINYCINFRHDILPIAMGARLEDYEMAAPHKSFLHVDQFTGPEHLAKFLHKLDQNDTLYNEYFQVHLIFGEVLFIIIVLLCASE